MTKQKGFTLVELLIVVSIIIIVVGVTGDIILSLVRSYSKTQITNEIEQNANFVMTKLDRELRSSSSVTLVSSDKIEFVRSLSGGGTESIVYEIKDSGEIVRELDGAGEVLLTNNTSLEGVYVVPGLSSFEDVSPGTKPKVIKVVLVFRQIGDPAVQFRQDLTLENTIVVRGSY